MEAQTFDVSAQSGDDQGLLPDHLIARGPEKTEFIDLQLGKLRRNPVFWSFTDPLYASGLPFADLRYF